MTLRSWKSLVPIIRVVAFAWLLTQVTLSFAQLDSFATRETINSPSSLNGLPTPEIFFGFRPGADKKLADYHQIVAYFSALAAASDRVDFQVLGKTTEGNDLVVVLISSPENLKRLEEWKNVQARLADPRTLTAAQSAELIQAGRSVVLINCSIHATEVGATQMSPELAYQLAAGHSPEVQEILDNVITLLVPCHNPDGQLMVVDWYRKHLDTPHEKAPLPWLYQKYTGHDNNRDWFMFTQKETQLTVEKLHNVWHPHITIDMHQMGMNGARLFVPPYIDPVEPNVDPIIVALLSMLGTYVQSVLTAQGRAGVVSTAIFDAWTPARAYPHYHGGLRFLTEAASVEVATPVTLAAKDLRGGLGYDARKASWNFPQPWPGGEWKLRDIVEYDFAAALAILQHAARNREFWLRSLHEVQRQAVTPKSKPAAFIIPQSQRDLQGLLDLLRTLQSGMVEIHRAKQDFSAAGAPFQAGDYLVRLDQPYGSFAKAMLEKQQYPSVPGPEGKPRIPYDVTAHTLPLFLGVDAIAVDELPGVALELSTQLTFVSRIHGNQRPEFFALSRGNTASYRAVNLLMKKGVPVWSARQPFVDEGKSWPTGTFLIAGGRHSTIVAGLIQNEALTAGSHGTAGAVELHGLKRAPAAERKALHPPRLGLYKSWIANMDEGWTRWVLEDFGFDYRTLDNAGIRGEDLRKSLEVIIFPEQSASNIEFGHAPGKVPAEYAGGIGEIGVRNLRRFVEDGGTLIALDSAAELIIKHFWLQVREVTAGLDRNKLSAPGSVLRVLADTAHPLAYGAQRDEAIFFLDSPAFELREGRSVLTYPHSGLLLSGWLEGEEHLAEQTALAEVPLGSGRVVLFGFRPQFRAQFRASYKFLFNAVLEATR